MRGIARHRRRERGQRELGRAHDGRALAYPLEGGGLAAEGAGEAAWQSLAAGGRARGLLGEDTRRQRGHGAARPQHGQRTAAGPEGQRRGGQYRGECRRGEAQPVGREHEPRSGCSPLRSTSAENTAVIDSSTEIAGPPNVARWLRSANSQGSASSSAAALALTVELADQLDFGAPAEELGYRYPDFSDSPRATAPAARARLRSAHLEDHYPRGHKLRHEARARLEEELKLIDELGLAGFFLLHWDVLELARECALEVRGRNSPRHSLPPGRGRGFSVGSLVCYLTGLSHVDPVGAELSLGRFLNRELDSVPDIDLDFPRDIAEADRGRHRALRA